MKTEIKLISTGYFQYDFEKNLVPQFKKGQNLKLSRRGRRGRLTSAELTTTGDTTASGGPKRVFTYAYASPTACPSKAGSNLDRTGGSRAGVAFVTCYDAQGRLASTTDPQLAAAGQPATAAWDGLGRLTSLSGSEKLAPPSTWPVQSSSPTFG
mgnify:CR=1 FL=1